MKFLFCLLTLAISLPSFANAAPWHTDYKRALAQAKAEQKPVLMYFTGSDFCGYCKQLDRQALDQKPFHDYADRNLVLLKLDFPARKPQSRWEREQNETLRMRYRVSGFPTLILLNPRGSVAGEVNARSLRPLLHEIERMTKNRR